MNTITTYNSLNKVAQKNGIVLLGSTFAYTLPLNELVQNYSISKKIYNRSIQGLRIKDAEQYIESCIKPLEPAKLIINLGDEDLNANSDVSELTEEYRWLLYRIHTMLPDTVLIITSVDETAENASAFNSELKKLSKEFGCDFIAIPRYANVEEHTFAFFKGIRTSLYDASNGFSELASKAVLDSMIQY